MASLILPVFIAALEGWAPVLFVFDFDFDSAELELVAMTMAMRTTWKAKFSQSQCA